MSALLSSSPSTSAGRHAHGGQRGAAMLEFAVVALPLLFLGLGSMELAHWFHTRHFVSLALSEASRAAVTSHNHPEHIIRGLETALKPLYYAANTHSASQGVVAALRARERALGVAPWQIEVLSPSAAAFRDFAQDGLNVSTAAGYLAINNNYLAEQSRAHHGQGWHAGLGPLSGQTVYQANTLVLRLNWLHRPRLPLFLPLLRLLGKPQGSYREHALAHGYLPMVRQTSMLMQSHPVLWPDHPSGKVLFRTASGQTGSNCRGWLCHAHTPPQDSPSFHANEPYASAEFENRSHMPHASNGPAAASASTESPQGASSGTGEAGESKSAHTNRPSSRPEDTNDDARLLPPGASDATGTSDAPPQAPYAADTPLAPPDVYHAHSQSPEGYGDLAVDPDDPACGVALCCV